MGPFKRVRLALLLGCLLSSCTPPVYLEDCAKPASVQLPNLETLCERQSCSLPSLDSKRLSLIGVLAKGEIDEALTRYQKLYEETKEHDGELLQHISIKIIEQSIQGEAEEQFIALFGAGMALHEKLLPLLVRASTHPIPQLQLAAIQFLAAYQDSRADAAINGAIGSRYLVTRIEAVYHLTRKRYSNCCGQIDALMAKIPPPLSPLFPPLYARLATPEAMKRLRSLMMAEEHLLRVSAILSAAKSGHHNFLPEIRSLSTQLHPAQQEACSAALGILQDEASVKILENLEKSPSDNVRLASHRALYSLGRIERRQDIEQLADRGNLFAVQVLGEVEGSEELLFTLMQNSSLQLRVNAGLALLQQRDNRALPVLKEVLLHDNRDLALQQQRSWGHSLLSWRVIPSARQNFASEPMAYEMSSRHKEALLLECMERLAPEVFLELAENILARQELPLIPLTVRCLENEQGSAATALLRHYSQLPGAPLTRHACRLALLRMGEPGPYQEMVQSWALEEAEHSIIALRPVLPWETHHQDNPYELSPDENSRLLVESFEALALQQTPSSTSALIEILKRSPLSNRPVIAGLLLRCSL